MNDNEVLDAEFNDDGNRRILEAVEWWENRRLIYNYLLLGVEVLVMLMNLGGLLFFGIITGIILTIIVNIVANIFYSLGWGIEVLQIYYFKKSSFTHQIRFSLFVLGTVFSLLWAFMAYMEALFGF